MPLRHCGLAASGQDLGFRIMDSGKNQKLLTGFFSILHPISRILHATTWG
jgi:hypothetical protein